MNTEHLKDYWYRYRSWIVAAVLIGLVLIGATVQRVQSQPLELTATPESTAEPNAEITIDIEGAVAVPGVRLLPAGSLIDHAIAVAGGLAPQADLERIAREINRAEKLKDNQKLYLPFIGEQLATAQGLADQVGKINLNTASKEELDKLPGIGPATADKIIAYREEHGGFSTVDELGEVSGIGDAKLAKLRELVMV